MYLDISIRNKLNNVFNNIKRNKNFYTFEGIDGSGKTSVIKSVEKKLQKKTTKKIFITSEPKVCDNSLCEKLTHVIYSENDRLKKDLQTQAFLYSTIRSHHVKNVIYPKLEAGYIVLCDRYVDSSLCYQGFLSSTVDIVCELNKIAIDNLLPMLTFYLCLDVDAALKRIINRDSKDSNVLDDQTKEYYKKISEFYELLSDIFKERFVKIDSTYNDIEHISDIVTDFIIKSSS